MIQQFQSRPASQRAEDHLAESKSTDNNGGFELQGVLISTTFEDQPRDWRNAGFAYYATIEPEPNFQIASFPREIRFLPHSLRAAAQLALCRRDDRITAKYAFSRDIGNPRDEADLISIEPYEVSDNEMNRRKAHLGLVLDQCSNHEDNTTMDEREDAEDWRSGRALWSPHPGVEAPPDPAWFAEEQAAAENYSEEASAE